MVRSETKIVEIISNITAGPSLVLYTVVDNEVQKLLESRCQMLNIPCVSILSPVVQSLGSFLDQQTHAIPGGQHVLNSEYFDRIAAMDFALNHDDGQGFASLEESTVILVGVSRTSKTPTCIYLANRGIKAANIPVVPNSPLPREIFNLRKPLIIGLTKDPRRLVAIRKQRLKILNQREDTDYVDYAMVTREIRDAQRLFDIQGWDTINVSRKSIEETSATILQMLFASKGINNGE